MELPTLNGEAVAGRTGWGKVRGGEAAGTEVGRLNLGAWERERETQRERE
eukprot:COSAG03_NODE_2334_length_2876_cov_23.659345_1_plen_50_part_00